MYRQAEFASPKNLEPHPVAQAGAEMSAVASGSYETDMRILRALQADGSKSVTEIAEQVGISQSPCSRRIIQLQDAGVIRGKNIDLDRRKLGFNALVVARVKLNKHDRDALEAFKQAIACHSGNPIRSSAAGRALVQDKLVTLPGVQEMESSVILDVVKKTTALPI
ncbi:Proline dehydrogenase transcriptional activator [Nymphon striatum]|nr:Proline dehydrogenase transcriptional activator [Nymphon striatum]